MAFAREKLEDAVSDVRVTDGLTASAERFAPSGKGREPRSRSTVS
jgi:hypothetical protein